MNAFSLSLQNSLEDILGDLWFARKSEDLGRLALLAYCEVRRWAREAGEQELARRSSELISSCPHASRDEFLTVVDGLITDLENVRANLVRTAPGFCRPPEASSQPFKSPSGPHQSPSAPGP